MARTKLTPSQLAASGQSAAVATQENTTSTTYADLTTTTDTVTAVIGANGLALVIVGCHMFGSTNSQQTFMSFVLSGANTLAASDANSFGYGVGPSASGAGELAGASRIILLTGLTAGSTTFKAKYRTSTGTGTFSNRNIAVIPL